MGLHPINNYFLDTILGKFATKVGIMDAVTKVNWDEEKKEALIHIRPPDPNTFDEVKQILRDTLKEIKSIKFSAKGQLLTYRGNPSLVLKIKERE